MFNQSSRSILKTISGRALQAAEATKLLAGRTDMALKHALNVDEDANDAAKKIGTISDNLGMIAAAAEEFSINMQQIQTSVRDAEQNVGDVSRATDELAAASEDIAQTTDKARVVSDTAVERVGATKSHVTGLEDAAEEISNLTQVINDIADQTKVLAMNATIEAARAGEAGRGFAVVARDVKDLATETREASQFIRARISTIETTISNTIAAIGGVAEVIGQLQEAVQIIAAAAEKQSGTSVIIAENTTRAASNFHAITNAIDEGATATADVTRRLADSAGQARMAKEGSERVAAASREIAEDATVSYASTLEIAAQQDEIRATLENTPFADLADEEAESYGLIRFSERFSVLVDDMDSDHNRIFGYVNAIHKQIKEGASLVDKAASFRAMAAFTTEHFTREEEMMERLGYPEIESHRELHKELLETVGGYAQALETGEPVNLIGALNFLNEWLRVHIQTVDRRYGEFFKANRIKAAVE